MGARILRQCQQAEVACFVKQVGKLPRMNYYAFHQWAELEGLDEDPPIYVNGSEWRVEWDGQPPPNAVVAFPVRDSHGGDWTEWPKRLRVREFPDSTRLTLRGLR